MPQKVFIVNSPHVCQIEADEMLYPNQQNLLRLERAINIVMILDLHVQKLFRILEIFGR